jgi:hypothetical protein
MLIAFWEKRRGEGSWVLRHVDGCDSFLIVIGLAAVHVAADRDEN